MMPMKNTAPLFIILLALITFFASTQIVAQQRYKITNPSVNFYAGTPLEDIDGTSDKLIGIIDAETNSFGFRIAMNTFQFPRKLMQEHYNENYLETDKYPNAEFKGEIVGVIDWEKAATYEVMAKGEFNVHGISKPYEIPSSITIHEDGSMQLLSEFEIILENHDIKRPKIVLMKIAEKADVTVKAELEKIN